jgi:hypothetical protein
MPHIKYTMNVEEYLRVSNKIITTFVLYIYFLKTINLQFKHVFICFHN